MNTSSQRRLRCEIRAAASRSRGPNDGVNPAPAVDLRCSSPPGKRLCSARRVGQRRSTIGKQPTSAVGFARASVGLPFTAKPREASAKRPGTRGPHREVKSHPPAPACRARRAATGSAGIIVPSTALNGSPATRTSASCSWQKDESHRCPARYLPRRAYIASAQAKALRIRFSSSGSFARRICQSTGIGRRRNRLRCKSIAN